MWALGKEPKVGSLLKMNPLAGSHGILPHHLGQVQSSEKEQVPREQLTQRGSEPPVPYLKGPADTCMFPPGI